jgi:hypothetical protein
MKLRILEITLTALLCVGLHESASAQNCADTLTIQYRLVNGLNRPFIVGTNSQIRFIQPQFDSAGSFREGLAHVRANKKVFYIDKSGKAMFQVEAEDGADFHEGLARITSESKSGYIDKNGKIVVPLQFEKWSHHFSGGFAFVGIAGKWGYIDKSGKMFIQPQFEDNGLGDFHENRALIKIAGKFGYVDESGTMVIQPQFDVAGDFSEGMASVHFGDKSGYIDKTGKLIFEHQFRSGDDFSEGLARVELGGSEGFIDKTGKLIIPLRFVLGGGNFHQGVARASMLTGSAEKYGYINKAGNMFIVVANATGVGEFGALTWARFNDGEKASFAVIDKSGKTVIRLPFTEIGTDIAEGLLAVRVGSQWGYVDFSACMKP